LFLEQPLSNSTLRTGLPIGTSQVVLKLIILVWGLESFLSPKQCFITFFYYILTRDDGQVLEVQDVKCEIPLSSSYRVWSSKHYQH